MTTDAGLKIAPGGTLLIQVSLTRLEDGTPHELEISGATPTPLWTTLPTHIDWGDPIVKQVHRIMNEAFVDRLRGELLSE